MKKPFLITVALFLFLAISLIAVSPAVAFEGRHFRPAEGLDRQNIQSVEVGWTLILSSVSASGSGVQLEFDIEGNPPPSLSTLAYGGWNGAYPMYCNYNSTKGILVCTIESGIRKHDSAYFKLWGQPFTVSIPEKAPEQTAPPETDVDIEPPSCEGEECPQ